MLSLKFRVRLGYFKSNISLVDGKNLKTTEGHSKLNNLSNSFCGWLRTVYFQVISIWDLDSLLS